MEYVILVILGLWSLCMIFKPDWVWKVEGMFLKRGAQPPEGYFTVMRVMGIFFLLFALGGAAFLATV